MEKVYDLEVLKNKNLTIPIREVKQVNTIKYVDKEYIDYKLSIIKNNRDRILIKFLWSTGTRISEALNVKKQDLLFDEDLIIINWQKKRKKMQRTIPMHKSLKEILFFYTGSMNRIDKLFPITRQRAEQITKKYLEISPHTLRHSFAVHFLRNGGLVTDLQRLLGHSNLNITAIYTELTQTDLKNSLNQIDF